MLQQSVLKARPYEVYLSLRETDGDPRDEHSSLKDALCELSSFCVPFCLSSEAVPFSWRLCGPLAIINPSVTSSVSLAHIDAAFKARNKRAAESRSSFSSDPLAFLASGSLAHALTSLSVPSYLPSHCAASLGLWWFTSLPRCQEKGVRKWQGRPIPSLLLTLHTMSWALLEVGALGYRQDARHGSDDGLLVCGWAWLCHRHALLPWHHFLPVIQSTLLRLSGSRTEMSLVKRLRALGHYSGFCGAWGKDVKIQSCLRQGEPSLLPGDIQREPQHLACAELVGVRTAGLSELQALPSVPCAWISAYLPPEKQAAVVKSQLKCAGTVAEGPGMHSRGVHPELQCLVWAGGTADWPLACADGH